MRAIVALLLLCAMAGAAQAQGGPARSGYSPVRPPISPYMHLFRGGVGGVPAYYSFVQPRIEYRQRVGAFNQELSELDQRTQMLQRSMTKPGLGTPSTAATFMNYSHFYPQSNNTPVR